MPAKKNTSSKPSKSAAAKKVSSKAKASKDVDEDSPASGGKHKALVIVESPAKAKTLKKYLGSGYQIKASVGHIRDLPAKKLGVDVNQNFNPVYEVMPGKADVVADLQEAARQCEDVYLAADPDREGEAIAWHIYSLLDKAPSQIHRIEFHEITKKAVQEAILHPREIDINRVNAQQARRILDRLVGYKLSPLLWKKVTKGLSAGRVQSVAVRLVCDREEEVLAFVPEEYWTIHCDVASATQTSTAPFSTEVSKIDGKKPQITQESDAREIETHLKQAKLSVSAVNKRESQRNPVAPFITSTLQREASTRYGYPVKKTMQIAQKLYEGIDAGTEGLVGLITYMRTDSTRIADEAQEEAKKYIVKEYGEAYYPKTPRVYLKKGKATQDAHEAIRPTSVFRSPQSLKNHLTEEAYKIYKIIWDRFVASQMESARVETKTLEIEAGRCILRASHTDILFPGYLAVYRSDEEETEEGEGLSKQPFPNLSKGDAITLKSVLPKQHFTEPPPRFNEASLVKTMDELGIGRPSTYAPTIATIQDRGYVIKEERNLRPTELGKTVNQLLVQHFKDIVDVHFTAQLENKLDEIAESALEWQGVVREFYDPFEATLTKAANEMEKVHVLIDNEMCPNCGKPMALKTSRWGSKFLGCTGYPDCKTTKPLTKDQKPVPDDKPSDEICEKCKGPMVIRYGQYGEYLACLDDECKAKRPIIIKTGVNCPSCESGEIVQRKSHRGKIFFGCNAYPKCNFVLWKKPTGEKCPDCGSMLVEKVLKKGTFHGCSSKECKFVKDAPPAPVA